MSHIFDKPIKIDAYEKRNIDDKINDGGHALAFVMVDEGLFLRLNYTYKKDALLYILHSWNNYYHDDDSNYVFAMIIALEHSHFRNCYDDETIYELIALYHVAINQKPKDPRKYEWFKERADKVVMEKYKVLRNWFKIDFEDKQYSSLNKILDMLMGMSPVIESEANFWYASAIVNALSINGDKSLIKKHIQIAKKSNSDELTPWYAKTAEKFSN